MKHTLLPKAMVTLVPQNLISFLRLGLPTHRPHQATAGYEKRSFGSFDGLWTGHRPFSITSSWIRPPLSQACTARTVATDPCNFCKTKGVAFSEAV